MKYTIAGKNRADARIQLLADMQTEQDGSSRIRIGFRRGKMICPIAIMNFCNLLNVSNPLATVHAKSGKHLPCESGAQNLAECS